MKAVDLTPCLLVDDISEALRFYSEKLNFASIMHFPSKEPFEWALVENGYVNIMFRLRQSMVSALSSADTPARGSGIILTLQVDDLPALYRKLKESVKVISPPHQNLYGATECMIEDCNGYLLSLIQDEI